MNLIKQIVEKIKNPSIASEQTALKRQNQLTKPKGSLGRLEEISIKMAGILGTDKPVVKHKAIMIFTADHGIAAQGVSAYPQEVTEQMVYNFLAGGAAINALAGHIGARILIIDMGVAADLNIQPGEAIRIHKIGYGTANMATGPAMTYNQAIRAVETGITVFEEECKKGLSLLIPGEMGIGNTTAATAIASVIINEPVEVLTGTGTGIDHKKLKYKISLIKQAIEINKIKKYDPLDILAKVGGFEIGAIAGAALAAASHGIPIVMDGMISTTGVLLADKLCPKVRKYCFASHNSCEKGHRYILRYLGLKPLLDLNLRLGEGSGAALAATIIEAACKVLTEMATFYQAGVSNKE
jgi:nicotinate-nucleotide--dimethylbenzimidazole phosphoribosyltransferase